MKKQPVSSNMMRCRKQVAQSPGSVLRKKIKDQEVEALWKQYRPNTRKRLFTPLLTLWTFIAQVLDPDKTLQGCRGANNGLCDHLREKRRIARCVRLLQGALPCAD